MQKSKIGTTISYFRKKAGLTQKQLADQLCVSDKAVSKWERGLSYPDITFISKLSKIFDTDADAIFIEEDKEISKSWCGLFYLPKGKSSIKLDDKIGDKYIIDIIISYFLLVSISKTVIVCDGTDNRFAKKYLKKFFNLKIEVVTSKDFANTRSSQILKNVTNIMCIYDLFFIYGVGLTSSFQRAMIEKKEFTIVTYPDIPIAFGDKKHILNFISDFSSIKDAEHMRLFRGYLYINLKSHRDISKCKSIIKMIEAVCGFQLYKLEDIISIRKLQ